MDAFADDRPIAFVKQGIRTLKKSLGSKSSSNYKYKQSSSRSPPSKQKSANRKESSRYSKEREYDDEQDSMQIVKDFDEMIRKDHEALTKQIEYEKKFDPEIEKIKANKYNDYKDKTLLNSTAKIETYGQRSDGRMNTELREKIDFINLVYDEIYTKRSGDITDHEKEPGKIRKNLRSDSVTNYASTKRMGELTPDTYNQHIKKKGSMSTVKHKREPSYPLKESDLVENYHSVPSGQNSQLSFGQTNEPESSQSPPRNTWKSNISEYKRKSNVFSTPNQHRGSKNFIESNKESNTTTKKIHKIYEKHLMNFDQHIKPLLDSWKNSQYPSPRKSRNICLHQLSARSRENSKRESARTSYIHDHSHQRMEPMCENLVHTASEMKSIYKEINHLTSQITEAAYVMQNALEKLDQFRQAEMNRNDEHKVPMPTHSHATKESGNFTTFARTDGYEGDYSEFTQ